MNGTRWNRMQALALALLLTAVTAACGGDDDVDTGSPPAADDPADAPDADFGFAEERDDADPALLEQSLGTTEDVPPEVLAAVARASIDVPDDKVELAIQCWREKTCDTGGGDVTVALADGFGENVWREITHMEFILQALTYPQIGRIIYTTAEGDTTKAVSDFRSLIAQGVDVIATFPDAGEALLPTAREATEQGIVVVPYIAGLEGEAGTDYLAFVAEDLCELGRSFAQVVEEETGGEGNIVFLGGTPGNPLSEAWQSCEEEALAPGIDLLGKADTNWTREGTLQAMSAFLSSHDQIDAISYEYADGFLGGVRAYEAANRELDVVLTLRTDEQGLFCEWQEIGNPDFRIHYSSGGSFQSRIALTAGMMALEGQDVPDRIVVPAALKEVTDEACNPDIPLEAPASTLVPNSVLAAMYQS